MKKILQLNIFKDEWWFEKESHTIAGIFLIFIICLSIMYYYHFSSSYSDFEADFDKLHEQAKIIEKDFDSIKKMENVKCNFSKDKKYISLISSDGTLELEFDENFTKILDYNEIKNDSFFMDMIFFYPMLAAMLTMLILMLVFLCAILIDERITNIICNIFLLVYFIFLLKIVISYTLSNLIV